MNTGSNQIDRLRSLLSAADILPEAAYRRNKSIYELVCYVNCMVGAELSGRTGVVELFRNRAPADVAQARAM